MKQGPNLQKAAFTSSNQALTAWAVSSSLPVCKTCACQGWVYVHKGADWHSLEGNLQSICRMADRCYFEERIRGNGRISWKNLPRIAQKEGRPLGSVSSKGGAKRKFPLFMARIPQLLRMEIRPHQTVWTITITRAVNSHVPRVRPSIGEGSGGGRFN